MNAVADDCFQIADRGYIREGYYADLVIVDPQKTFSIAKENILYKCGWSPLEGFISWDGITHTFVNGHLFMEIQGGMSLLKANGYYLTETKRKMYIDDVSFNDISIFHAEEKFQFFINWILPVPEGGKFC